MDNKILIKQPNEIGCVTHDKYMGCCKPCILINKEITDTAKTKASDIAYMIVYKKWKGYLQSVKKPSLDKCNNAEKNMIEDGRVKVAKRNITRDLYPFTDDSAKFCRSVWNAAIKDLSRLLWGYAPIIKVDVGKKIKKRVTLWY